MASVTMTESVMQADTMSSRCTACRPCASVLPAGAVTARSRAVTGAGATSGRGAMAPVRRGGGGGGGGGCPRVRGAGGVRRALLSWSSQHSVSEGAGGQSRVCRAVAGLTTSHSTTGHHRSHHRSPQVTSTGPATGRSSERALLRGHALRPQKSDGRFSPASWHPITQTINPHTQRHSHAHKQPPLQLVVVVAPTQHHTRHAPDREADALPLASVSPVVSRAVSSRGLPPMPSTGRRPARRGGGGPR